jgi:TolB-like protein
VPTLPTPQLPESDLQLEIAHLLLIDTVGYSNLLVNEQIESVQELGRIVRSTDCFRTAEASGKLIRVPTGDGMALLFFQSPEEPVRCALEISQKLKENSNIRLRMGIHSGPVNQVKDVNDTLNVAGTGINVAQRIMDCGDAGHILLSKHVADDLGQYRHWQPYLHDFGECEVKHGLRLHIVSLYKDGLGNPALPEKLRRGKRWRQKSTVRPISPSRWPRTGLIAALSLSILAAAVSSVILLRRTTPSISASIGNAAIPEKSIAVLPFENLSDDKQNVYFIDGVHDEILSNLAKVSDLKVISHTSVMQYRTAEDRNLREIAKALRVAHIVEGSVQRVGDRVRVSAQLIDARSDTHVWAEHYDRQLADVFALESELAEQIVSRLKAKLSPQEKAAIEEQPTNDLTAYDLYARAKSLQDTIVFDSRYTEHLSEAARLLESAIARDPKFFAAHCLLAAVYDEIFSFDHTSERLAAAEATVQTAFRLRPDAPEAHLAAGRHWYWGYRDYDRARQELSLAAQSRPNDPLVFELSGFVDRRQGRWQESTRELQRALELDPLNLNILQAICFSYERLRRFSDAAGILDRALQLAPSDVGMRVRRAGLELWSRADPKPLHSTIQSIIQQDKNGMENVALDRLQLALIERDWKEAGEALGSLRTEITYDEGFPYPRSYFEGLIARFRGDKPNAQKALNQARAALEKLQPQQENYAEALAVLGLVDAALGNKARALAEGRRAFDLLPPQKDAINGEIVAEILVMTYIFAGEKDEALNQLETLTRLPGGLNYGNLRLHPVWDPLRDDPRFNKIVGYLAPVPSK